MRAPALDAEGIHVVCPGSTSNLGSGFDTLGLAVNRYLTLHLMPAEKGSAPGLMLERRGTLAALGQAIRPGDDLIVSTLTARVGTFSEPMRLIADSNIPVGKGLGSSASARVAGEVLSALLTEGAPDPMAVLEAAANAEGHPDNVAPAVLGGLVAAGTLDSNPPGDPRGKGGGPDIRSLPLSPEIGWGYAAPASSLGTRESRAALPKAWPRDVVARSLSRLARLIPSLAHPGVDGEKLRGLFDDELHVPYRRPLSPGALEAAAAARAEGAWGVTLSGAGSGLIALGPRQGMGAIVSAMRAAFLEADSSGQPDAFGLEVEARGVRWGAGAPHGVEVLTLGSRS